MFRDSHLRSIAKALSWRLLGTTATTALVLDTRALSVEQAGAQIMDRLRRHF